MTDKVNATVADSVEAGEAEFLNVERHGNGTDILIDELDSRAKLNSGITSPESMMQGIEQETAGVIFIGYHIYSGSQFAGLAQTWNNAWIA